MKGIQLRVKEALPSDMRRNIIRMTKDNLLRVGAGEGEPVYIKGKKITIAMLAESTDFRDDNAARMNAITRENCGAGVGENINIAKATPKPLEEIVISPTEKIDMTENLKNYIKKRLKDNFTCEGDSIAIPLIGRPLIVKMSSLKPEDANMIDEMTKINLQEEAKETQRNISYEDIGGLHAEIRRIREMIDLPLKHPQLFDRLGVEPPRGILLYGAPGTGKTLLAKAVANEANVNFVTINSPEVVSKFYGDSEEKLRNIFKDAEEKGPSIIFIDEIDAICPKREETSGQMEKRIVAQLLAVMDGMERRSRVIVIAATNRVNSLDPALRRPGRFDREIEVKIPDKEGRLEILQVHTSGMPLAEDVSIKDIAGSTHGFVGADLAALCKEAAYNSIRRSIPDVDTIDDIPKEVIEKIRVELEDFKHALKEVQPSALRELLVEVPNVPWTHIGGLENIKMELRKAIEWPMKFAKSFRKLNLDPPKGVILYGPPGTGKTLLAKAVATESEANFISIKGPEIFNKYVGESEKAIREIFKKAKQSAPCIIFFDEIDSIAPVRNATSDNRVGERVVNQLLTEMDGLEELRDVFIIGATNRPDLIDKALIRPGRFEKMLYIPAPNEGARRDILKIHLLGVKVDDNVIDGIAGNTEEYSGADLAALCREAKYTALEKDMESEGLTQEDFDKALQSVKPSITDELKSRLDEFKKNVPVPVVGYI